MKDELLESKQYAEAGVPPRASEAKQTNDLIIQMDSNSFFNASSVKNRQSEKSRYIDPNDNQNRLQSNEFSVWYAPHAQNTLDPSAQLVHTT